MAWGNDRALLRSASLNFPVVFSYCLWLFVSTSAGADIFRLNFSHGEHQQKADLVDVIRAVEKKYDHPIAIMADLQVSNTLIHSAYFLDSFDPDRGQVCTTVLLSPSAMLLETTLRLLCCATLHRIALSIAVLQ